MTPMTAVLMTALLAAPASSTFTESEARALASDVSKAVERIRELKFKTPVAMKVVDDATARRHFEARLSKFWPPAEVALETRAYIQLGLMPRGTDVVGRVLELLEEQAGGYYDPETGTFFILNDMPRAAAPILMAHELTHALEDQVFDIDARLEEAAASDDRGTAMGAVVEGSGTLVMTAYIVRELEAGRLSRKALVDLQESEAGRAQKLRTAAPLLQRLLMAPYLLGPAFLSRGDTSRLSSGVVSSRDINHAFADPPTSTEQILHPEKYWDKDKRDEPRRIKLPDLSETIGRGFRLSLNGGLGELTCAVLTGAPALDISSGAAVSPARWTNAAAAGWDGDRLQLYESEKGSATVLATVWDSPEDAAEFEALLADEPPKTVLRQGDIVVIVATDTDIDQDAVAKAALKAVADR